MRARLPCWDTLITQSGLARGDARALAMHASGHSREWLLAHGDEPAEAIAHERFLVLAERARAGQPIAYLLGWREFHGRRFEVGPAVLIPREDTELIVNLACERLPAHARVVDLGTGSGCIAITLACERPDLQVTATDASADALAVAARNAQALLGEGRRLRLLQGDWYAGLPTGERFDAIVSNPPYIAAGDAHLAQGDLRHEPPSALTDGADGLQALRRIIEGAMERLERGGWLMLEHGWDQGPAVRALLDAAGLKGSVTLTDLSGNDRVSCARTPGSA